MTNYILLIYLLGPGYAEVESMEFLSRVSCEQAKITFMQNREVNKDFEKHAMCLRNTLVIED